MCWRNVGFGRAVIYGGDYLFMGVYADSGGGAVERVRLWPGVVEFAVRQVAPTVTWGYTGGTEQGCKGAGGAGVCSQCPGCITPLPPPPTQTCSCTIDFV